MGGIKIGHSNFVMQRGRLIEGKKNDYLKKKLEYLDFILNLK